MVIRFIGVLAVCLMQAGFAFGQIIDPIQELMAISGLDEQIWQMWTALRSDLADYSKGTPGGNVQMIEQLERELTLTINIDTIRARIIGRLKNDLVPAEIATVLDFFRSPLGERIKQLQGSAWISERLKLKMGPGGPSLAPTEHIDRLRRLGVETHALQVFMAWRSCAATALLFVSVPPSTPVSPPGTAAFEAEVDETVQMSERELREIDSKDFRHFAASPAYAFLELLYRPFTRDNQEKYLEFAQSQGGSKFYRTSGTAIVRSWIGACLEAGYRLRERITDGGTR